MDVLHLSTSLISAWPLCPLRAWSSYVTRNQHGNDYSGTEPTRFGNVIHEVAERAHKISMAGGEVPSPIDLFDEVWREWDCFDYDYHALGLSKVEDFLRRTFMDRPATARTIGAELSFLLDIVNGTCVLIGEMSRDEVSKRVARIIALGGVPIISTIDRIDFDEETGIYRVYDYKTNAQPFARDFVENSLQLGIYAIAAIILFEPESYDHVVCVYDMVRHGRFQVQFSPERLQEQAHYLENLWHQIRQAQTAEPRINQFCYTCEIRGNCPAYIEALEMEQPPIWTDTSDIEEVVRQFQLCKDMEKVYKNRAQELGAMLSEQVVSADGNPVAVGDSKEVYLQPNPRYSFDVRKVMEVLERNRAISMLPSIIKVQNTELDKALRSVPFKDEIMALREQGFASSSVKIRAAKNAIDFDEETSE